MKPYKTLIFIFSLLAGLALLSFIFPRDGIRLGSILFEFPSLSAVLGEPAEVEDTLDADIDSAAIELSPEELMAQRLEALHAAKDSEFVAYMETSPTRFYLPDSDAAYLDPVFDAMLQARQRPMRIMYYGDSQLECDRITDVLREHLQNEFGGNGAGLLPAVQTIGTTTARVSTWPELTRYVGFGAAGNRSSHRRYGPLSQMALVQGHATFQLSAIGGSSFPHCGTFRKVSIAVAGEGRLTLQVGETEYELNAPEDSVFEDRLHLFSKTLPSAVSKATLVARGHMEVYGIMLDGGAGISLDNIAMRGSSGTHFTATDQNSMAPFFQQQNIPLIILQYGGNSVPYLRSGKGISNYKRQIMAQIACLKRLSPRSRIIFIGPADMATTSGEGENITMHTYPQLPQVVDSLRSAALESGAAFWDMFRVMGGRGSMVKWVNARPQLAGEDYIHFTPRGARHISNLLWETLDFYYKYYRFRKGLDPEVLPEDTLTHETDTLSDARSVAL